MTVRNRTNTCRARARVPDHACTLHSQTLNGHKEYMHELHRDAQACASSKQGWSVLEEGSDVPCCLRRSHAQPPLHNSWVILFISEFAKHTQAPVAASWSKAGEATTAVAFVP